MSSAKYVKAWRKRNVEKGLNRDGQRRKKRNCGGLSMRNRKMYMRLWRVHKQMKPPQNVSQAVRKLNPHIYGQTSLNSVGSLPKQERQSHPIPALDKGKVGRPAGQGSVGLVVTLVSYRHKLLDGDNLVYSLKGLRDSVAKSIGLDDADRRVRWQYGQVETRGEQGTVVTIETL